MSEWGEMEAEQLVDDFVHNDSSDNFLMLKDAVVESFCQAYKQGTATRPDEKDA